MTDDTSGNSMPVKDLLARWQSHKVVRAGKIVHVADSLLKVEGADGLTYSVTAAANMFARYMPVPGDYYVVYDDGYASISPRQAFEEGYHRL